MMNTSKFNLRDIQLTPDKVDQSAMLNYLVGYLSAISGKESITTDEIWTAVIRAEKHGVMRMAERNKIG